MILIKQIGVSLLGAINLILIVWATLAHRRRQSLPEAYYKLLLASVGVSVFQVGVGLWFLLEGKVVTGRHLFYGIVVGTGALGQALLGRRLPLGQRYRGKPLVYAFFGLVVLASAVRSWLTA